jgi:hypothetical protein
LSIDVADYQQFQVNPTSTAFSNNPFFFRPPPYTLFLLPFSNAIFIYAIPFVQGLLVAYLVHLALRVARIRVQPKEFVILFLLLSVATSLPWYSGQIMPDVFTGMVILLFFSLMCGVDDLTPLERVFAALLLTGALGTHLSHLSVFVGLLAVFGGYWLLFNRKLISFRSFVVWLLSPLVLVVVMLLASNYIFSKKLVLSESSDLLYLARLVGDGTAQEYLRDKCPQKPYLLCADLQKLDEKDADGFLWDADGAWSRYQNNAKFLVEAKEIVRGTLIRDPLAQAQSFLQHSLTQLVTFGIDSDLTGTLKSYGPQKQVNPLGARLAVLDDFGENISAIFADSRQVQQHMPLFGIANTLQTVVVLISILTIGASVPLLMAWRQKCCVLFISVVVTGILCNAFGLGALSIVVADRYQNRVIWLLPLAAFAAAWQLMSVRASRAARPDHE